MKNKNLILLALTLCLAPFKLLSQLSEIKTTTDTLLFAHLGLNHNDEDSFSKKIKIDSVETKSHKENFFGLEQEAVDSHARIETLEVGFNTHKDMTFFSSIRFPVNEFANGRLFLASFRINKNGDDKPGHYSTGAIDLTLFNSPIDLTFGLDNDRLGKNPYRRSEFVGLSIYLNDIPKLHNFFHIARYSPGYHFYHTGIGDSSTQKNGIQHSVFMQTQPIRFAKNLLVSTETYFLSRKGANLFEFDLGFRHKRVMSERLVIGTTFSVQNGHYHGTMIFARISIMQTNCVPTNWGTKTIWHNKKSKSNQH